MKDRLVAGCGQAVAALRQVGGEAMEGARCRVIQMCPLVEPGQKGCGRLQPIRAVHELPSGYGQGFPG